VQKDKRITRDHVLLSFTGFQDPYALGLVGEEDQPGPILSLLNERTFSKIILFSTPKTSKNTSDTVRALKELYPDFNVEVLDLPLDDPTDYISILRALRNHIRKIIENTAGAKGSISGIM